MKIKDIVVKNYIFNAGYQVMALLVPLITTPYISRVLNSEGIGIYSYTFSVVSYFTLCSILGTAIYGKKQIGILQDEPVERTKKFLDILSLRILTSAVVLVLYLLYVFLFADNKTVAYLQSFYILGVMTDVSWLFQGMEDFERIAIRNFIFKFINVLLVFVFIKDEHDLWKYVLLLSLLTVIGNISIWPFLSKYLVKIHGYKIKPFDDIKLIMKLFIPAVATQLYTMIDKNMIGNITQDPSQNGYYEQAEKIVKMSLILITTIATVLLPKVSKAYSQNNHSDVKKYLHSAYNFAWFMGIPLMCGVVAISPILVPVFFGDGYEPVMIILPILSLLFIFMSFNQINATLFFISLERENVYLKFFAVGGVINIGLNLVFIPQAGAIGAAIGTVIGELIITILELAYIVKNQYVSIGELFGMSVKYIIAGAAMLVLLRTLISVMRVTAFNVFVLILLGVIAYFLMLVITKEKYVMKVLRKV